MSGDAHAYVASRRARYDLVIMNEIIEHVERPVELVREAAQLLRDQGRLLITTPNRSFFVRRQLWDYELPPVHLWWFSERSIDALASASGLVAELIDFSPLNRARPINPIWRYRPPALDPRPTLDREYRLVRRPSHSETRSEGAGASPPARRVAKRALTTLLNPAHKRLTQAALLGHPPLALCHAAAGAAAPRP